jgi:hypothetical protein
VPQDKSKLPPMPSRDAGGSFELDDPDDGTPIKEMLSLNDRLLLITEKCTYEVKLADQIDPKRTNPNLPHNVRRKLFNHGTNSELLCNTLLLAKVMFRKEFQPQLDIASAMARALDALAEIVSMEQVAKDFSAAQNAAIEKAALVKQQARSFSLPSLGNVDRDCKTFTQKAHHFGGALLKIVRLFYPEAKNWDKFQEIIEARYGKDEPICTVVAETKPVLLLVLNTRDSLEHHNEGVTTIDFEMQPDGSVGPPTIEVNYRKSKLARCSISSFMDEVTKSLLISFEMIVTHMCSKSAQPLAGMPITIGLLSDGYRAAWHVRFAYGMYGADGQFTPIG